MELEQKAPDMDKLPGGWKPEQKINLQIYDISVADIKIPMDGVMVIDNLLTDVDCMLLISLMNSAPELSPVSIHGLMEGEDDQAGSVRSTMWTPYTASQIWKKLEHIGVLNTRAMSDFTATDWWQGNKARRFWTPCGASPMMRFMRYDKMGQHYAHYDAGYIYENDNYRTLMSYVIYLTDCEEGGATRFIKDDQQNIPVWDRKHEDWTREATDAEVLCSVQPKKGTMLLFDHRMCHDVEQYMGDTPRIIIRGDIIFKAGK
jgi:hypothetical protein